MRLWFRALASDKHQVVNIHHKFSDAGLKQEGPVLRFALGLETWFRLPEQGMSELEILSSGSVFVTPALSSSFPALYHVVAPAHVTHPWQFRHFYAGEEHDWLDNLREDAIEVRLSARELGTGRLLAEAVLEKPHVHPQLDLSVWRVRDEVAALRKLEDSGIPVLPLPLAAQNEITVGTPVALIGHDKSQESGLLFPCSLNGVIEGDAEGHVAVRTLGDLSPMGLCGGPALIHTERGPASAGMVFARVKTEEGTHPIEGHTLLISSPLIEDFIKGTVEQAT